MEHLDSKMKISARVYSYIIAYGGLLFTVFMLFRYISLGSVNADWPVVLTLAALIIISRSFPLYVDTNIILDLSFLFLLTAMLIYGIDATVSLLLVCTPLEFNSNYKKENNHFLSILNAAPIKTLFNMGNHALSIYFGSVVFKLVGGVSGDLSLPGILLPLLMFVIVVMVTNSVILFALLSLNGQVSFFEAFRANFVDMISSWIATTPIGYFFALILTMPSGSYLAILFFIPFGLARYAFKLYIDSRNQTMNLIHTLIAAVEAKDKYTKGHSVRVSDYAELLAYEMNFPKKKIETLRSASVLHDIGKIGIRDDILNKNAMLTPEEWETMKKHPGYAKDILQKSSMPENVLEIILHHHERYDGTGGYPPLQHGETVSLSAYILTVADTFDAITSDRPYRAGKDPETAISIIAGESGKQFHPTVVNALLRSKEKISKMVQDFKEETEGV